MNTTIDSSLNGFDTTAQKQIFAGVSQNPEMAKVTFQVSNDWIRGSKTESKVSSFMMGGKTLAHKAEHKVVSDMPGQFLGSDSGPTPAELALQALAACMNSTMLYNCAARGIGVRSSVAYAEGDLDARKYLHIQSDERAGYRRIRVRFEVDTDATAEELKSLSTASPMFDVFTNGVPVEVELAVASDS